MSMHVCAHRIKHITGPEILRGSTWIQIFFQLQSSFTAADFSELHQHKPKKRRLGFTDLE